MLKRMTVMIFLSACLVFSGMAQQNIDRAVEDGVEIVSNHLEPYKIKGEPTSLILERQFSIDTEQDDIVEKGLVDIETFDVDSEGNIYLIRWRSNQNYIYKFDKTGRYLLSFLRQGQGPGEIEWGGTVLVWTSGEIMAKDPSKKKILLYDPQGKFIREASLPTNTGFEATLGNERYLVSWQAGQSDYRTNYFGISGPDFKIIKELGKMGWPDTRSSPRVKLLTYIFVSAATKDAVFIGDAQKGYEIEVFDVNGKLFRKIRKKSKPLKIPDEIKERYAKPVDNPAAEEIRKKAVFPDRMPPFRYLFTDDEGRLYVMTWEKSKDPKEYMYDIFNAQGAFICRTSLGNYYIEGPFKREWETRVVARGGYLYSLFEKESGYKELVVHKMVWK